MLDFREHRNRCDWDPWLKPIGYGDFSVETFENWWARVEDRLHNLSPEICEQWIYKHWQHSPMKFIPLNGLNWREEQWDPRDFIARVKSWRSNESDELEPTFDYQVFHTFPGNPTAKALDTGNWDYAPVLLPTPGGFTDTVGTHVDAEFLLVEGHQRRRYLNAILHQGRAVGPQRVFILGGWPVG